MPHELLLTEKHYPPNQICKDQLVACYADITDYGYRCLVSGLRGTCEVDGELKGSVSFLNAGGESTRPLLSLPFSRCFLFSLSLSLSLLSFFTS